MLRFDLIEILESDLNGLLAMRGRRFSCDEANFYYPILLAYLTGDLPALFQATEKVVQLSRSKPELEPLVALGRLRYQIRTRMIDPKLIFATEEQAKKANLWQGELHFALSNAYAAQENHELARDHSLASARALKEMGARKKAVRALMNAISSESCFRPEKHYLADLHFIYRRAKESGDLISVGNTLINLSREYQKLGLYAAALKYAHRAIAVFSKNAGGIDYHLALTHRAHIYCQLDSFFEARTDAELAMNCTFPEVQGSIEILRSNFPSLIALPIQKTNLNYVTPTWKERNFEKAAKRTAKLEGRLIELLTHKSHSKRELCEILYGNRLRDDVTENRLNNLLNRIRKRNPRLIVFRAAQYHLAELPFYPSLEEA